MKKLILTLTLLLAALVAHNAYAIAPSPGDERAEYYADMEIFYNSGVYSDVEFVRLIKNIKYVNGGPIETNKGTRYGLPVPVENFQLDVFTSGHYKEYSINLAISNTQMDACGSTIYTLLDTSMVYFAGINMPQVTYKLYDHSTRLCEDYRPNLLEMVVKSVDYINRTKSVLSIGGNPEAIYHIMRAQ